tara:strand:+ start:187 stop:636 length:450 start_codon:yes stop_codon:yes gene_type:complete
MSYFAKPNFIVYDEWFIEDFEKSKRDFQNKQIKTISKIHDFFYEQSNQKIGASENILQLDIKVNEKEQFTNDFFDKISNQSITQSNKKLKFLKKLTKSELNFNITKNSIYFVSIFGLVFILGFYIFYNSQPKRNQSAITNKSFVVEKEV